MIADFIESKIWRRKTLKQIIVKLTTFDDMNLAKINSRNKHQYQYFQDYWSYAAVLISGIWQSDRFSDALSCGQWFWLLRWFLGNNFLHGVIWNRPIYGKDWLTV